MKVALAFSTLLIGASAFGVAPHHARVNTALGPAIAEADMSESQLEIKDIASKWAEIRHLSREEAEKTLEGDWLEAYNRFYEKYDDDMVRMAETAANLEKMLSPPQLPKKSKSQRKRDAYARKVAIEKARAKAAL